MFGINFRIVLAPLAMNIAVGVPPPLSGLEEALHYPQRVWYENLAGGLALVAFPILEKGDWTTHINYQTHGGKCFAYRV